MPSVGAMSEPLHKPASFLGLPLELREHIYTQLLSSQLNKHAVGDDLYRYRLYLSIFRVSHQIYNEARRVFRRKNVFIRIETPWREAEGHVANQGRVPLLATGENAELFNDYHLAAIIDIPGMEAVYGDATNFVICLEDLHLFCKMWMYSDLSHPGLNGHLRLKLNLQNPNQEFSPNEKRELPITLQRRLLEPFGTVKGLRDFSICGDYDASVGQAVRDCQAVPHMSPEKCLREADKLKEAGNTELKNGNYREAIRLYELSFLAVHIVVSGRRRNIWADAYFEGAAEGEADGLYNGHHAGLARMILRIRLVANTILAYYKLGEYEEAKFWGMRSIALMRDALGAATDEPQPNFPAADSWGKVFYRTALACKALDEMQEARELLRVAERWLPRDEIVKREVAACALRLG